MSKPLVDLTGQVFGRLTVVHYRAFTRQWLCRCECGGEKYVRGWHLIQGKTTSCGCLRKHRTRKSNRKVRTKCPCCGQALAQPIELADPAMVHLPTQQQALFNLVKSNPQGLTGMQIRERIFHTNRNGEPYCDRIVGVTVYHLNKKIAAWGLKLSAISGPGSIYRLVVL